MSKNGPPWSHGEDEPYTEPADPWGEQAASVSEPAWAASAPSAPRQPVGYPPAPVASHNAMWGPPAAPPRRSTPMLVLILSLVLLIVAGLVVAAWLLANRNDPADRQAAPSASAAPAGPGPAPMGSEDARFYVKEGDCVINEGSDTKPEMRTSPCASGTYKVLKQIKGKTTGEKDAESKCAKVHGYTKWYFYDSPLDDLDFVLCLREH